MTNNKLLITNKITNYKLQMTNGITNYKLPMTNKITNDKWQIKLQITNDELLMTNGWTCHSEQSEKSLGWSQIPIKKEGSRSVRFKIINFSY